MKLIIPDEIKNRLARYERGMAQKRPTSLELPHPYYMNRSKLPPGVSSAVSSINKVWVNGSIISFKLIAAMELQRYMVYSVLNEIMEHANLIFVETERDDAEMRVGFDRSQGSYSYVGRDSLFSPADQVTVNFGWDDYETYRHEFGHFTGRQHEQGRKDLYIDWNHEYVYKAIGGPPNNWPREKVDLNFFYRFEWDSILFSAEPDLKSNMIYSVLDRKYTHSGMIIRAGKEYSPVDIEHFKRIYPKASEDNPDIESGDRIWNTAPELIVNADPFHARIGKHYEEDIYVIDIKKAGWYRVETLERTDTHLELYGPDSATRLAYSDENGSLDPFGNSRIDAYLEPGIYLPQVRHFNPQRMGDYAIQVRELRADQLVAA